MENQTANIKETEEKREINYLRNKKYGVLAVSPTGWSKEVCNVSWNDKSPKLDIREWNSDYTKMSKGLTFTKEESKKLLKILNKVNFEDFETFKSNLPDSESADDSVDVPEDLAVTA